MAQYEVLVEDLELEGLPSPVKGSLVTLDEELAAPLVENGSLSAALPPPPATPTPAPSTENNNVPEQPAQSPKFDAPPVAETPKATPTNDGKWPHNMQDKFKGSPIKGIRA